MVKKFCVLFLVLSILVGNAYADECSSKIAIWGDCISGDLIIDAIAESKPEEFLITVRRVYDTATTSFGIRNNPLNESTEFPGQMLVSLSSGFRYGLLGRDFNKARDGQYEFLVRFCDKHGGKILPSFVLLPPNQRAKSAYDVTVNVCTSNDGKALAAIGTRMAIGGATKSEMLFSYYFSGQLLQSIFDFRANAKPGDKTQFGLITDVRGSIANVQNGHGQTWVEVEKLLPFEFLRLKL